jgi:hypothetical protein
VLSPCSRTCHRRLLLRWCWQGRPRGRRSPWGSSSCSGTFPQQRFLASGGAVSIHRTPCVREYGFITHRHSQRDKRTGGRNSDQGLSPPFAPWAGPPARGAPSLYTGLATTSCRPTLLRTGPNIDPAVSPPCPHSRATTRRDVLMAGAPLRALNCIRPPPPPWPGRSRSTARF